MRRLFICLAVEAALALVPTPLAPQPRAAAPLHRTALPPRRRGAAPRLFEADSFYDEYVETDPATGQQKKLSLGDKEKRYLECLDSYYNEGGKQLLGDEAYEQLKLDLDFEGSRVATFSKDEIRFLLANKRYQMGSPVLADEEYNALRETLRVAGSQVVLHDAASCNLLTGVCKSDHFGIVPSTW